MDNSTAKAEEKKYNPDHDDRKIVSGFSVCKGLQADLGGVVRSFNLRRKQMEKILTSKKGIQVTANITEDGTLDLTYAPPIINKTITYHATYDQSRDAWTGYVPGISSLIGVTLNPDDTKILQRELAAEQAQAKSRELAARRQLESTLTQYRVLERSGHFLGTGRITTVCLLSEIEQQQYAGWCRGRVVMQSVDAHAISICINDSPTAQAIVTDNRSKSNLTYASVESQLIPITLDQEQAIITECKQLRDGRAAAAAAEKNEADQKMAAIFALAKSTGKKHKIDGWMTNDCTEHLADCSFDAATKWAMPDGTTEITYNHCY